MNFGLERIKEALTTLHDFHDDTRVFQCIHVAGTNGKGSVTSVLAALLVAHAKKTSSCNPTRIGLFQSPFLMTPNDAISVDLQPMPHPEYKASRIQHGKQFPKLSSFELDVLVALRYFAAKQCRLVIMEAGLGGLLDATNVFSRPMATLLTSVSLDHTAQLGTSVDAILHHKLAITRPNVPFYIAEPRKSDDKPDLALKRLIEATVLQHQRVQEPQQTVAPHIIFVPPCQLVRHDDLHGTQTMVHEKMLLECSLLGRAQLSNVALALAVLPYVLSRCQLGSPDVDRIGATLRHLVCLGRLTWLDDVLRPSLSTRALKRRILVDGAHNAAGMLNLSDFVQQLFIRVPYGRRALVLAFSASKDLAACLDNFSVLRCFDVIYLVQFVGPRLEMPWIEAASLSQLEALVRPRLHDGQQLHSNVPLSDILAAVLPAMLVEDGFLLFTGSLYLMSDIYVALSCK